MAAPRLKAEVWVQALIRQCRGAGIDAYLVRRGDSDAGAIMVKHNRFEAGCTVYAPAMAMDGGRAWSLGTGQTPVPEADADAYIQRQLGYDPDIWVVEVEDMKGEWSFGEQIV